MEHPGVSVPNSFARMIEVNMGVWAACAPIMKPFVRFIRARYFRGDTDILHASRSTLSFWHRSWWRPSTEGRSSSRARRRGIPVNRTGDIIQTTGDGKSGEQRSRRGGLRRFLIPSLILGNDFENDIMADGELRSQAVRDVKAIPQANQEAHLESGVRDSIWSEPTLRNPSN